MYSDISKGAIFLYHIIVNPVAGKGRTIDYLPQLIEEFDKRNMPCTAHVTTKIRDAYDFAREICTKTPEDTPQGIIGVGGDGTIQEIVAGMVDAFPHGQHIPTPLAICPVGSGNDFVTSLKGKKTKKTPSATDFIGNICKRNLRTVDVITANGEAFLNIANIGVDARIVQNAAGLKQTHGGRAYLAAVYKSIMKHENTTMTLAVNGREDAKPFTLIAICNGQFYGGGLRIAPSAKFDDGKITLCVIEGVSRAKLGILFPSLLIEKHTALKIVQLEECTELTITLKNTETLCLDGNLFPQSGEIYFKILPKVLDVFM